MKQWIAIILIIIFLFSCQPKKEIVEETQSNQIDIVVEQPTETIPIVSKETSEMGHVTESEYHEEPDTTKEIFVEYGRLLSGSWTKFPNRVDGERKLSWGIVPFANLSYTLIDFIAEQPVYIMGHTEGGPVGYDNRVAEVEKMEIVSPGTFIIHYVDDTSGMGPRRGEFVFHYDSENDTISLIERNGIIFDSPQLEYRVSEKLPE